MILVLGICGSQTSNEITGYFKPYNVKNSNDVLTISTYNSTYKLGQTINIMGKVNRYDEGTRVPIQILDPGKSVVASFYGLVDRYGIFRSFFTIPETFSNGKYLLSAYYDGDPHVKQVSLSINISASSNAEVHILIPFGVSSQVNKLNFNPPTVTVKQGTKIVWINNDVTLHTVTGGKVNDDGSLSLDPRFKGSFVTPGNTLKVSLAPGKYSYFCQIHPWLGGLVTVESNQSHAAKTQPKSITTTAKTPLKSFPVSNNVLLSIWKERKDLQKLYPEVAKGKLANLTKWATAKGWSQDKRLSVLIPPGKVPSYLDNVLLSIWKERKDLQKLYPEVTPGHLGNLTKWATTIGWSQEKALSALIPPGKVPKY